MLQHLLYVLAPSQMERTKAALERLDAKPLALGSSITLDFELRHRLLENLVLRISLLTDLDGVTPHLRQNPVDLLIYDERGEDAIDAMIAIRRIRDDVRSLAELWGPDFLFPMSRVVAILDGDANEPHSAFDLGRLQVRDVMVAPQSTALLLRWLKGVLSHGIIRQKKIGLALSGGGIEGFLYQIGVIHALNMALTRKSIADCDVIAGVSSGAIAGGMVACGVETSEIIRSMHGVSDVLPPLSSNTLFDIAGTKILQRIARESIGWGTLKPSQWLTTSLRSVPTGFFKGDKLEEYFRVAIQAYGLNDTFDGLKSNLYVGATDQDSFEHVTFGEAPWDKLPVSVALRASCALPPVFTPKAINGRLFIDGQVTRSCNLEVAVDKGCRLIFVIDPLKPHATATAGSTDQQGGFYGIIQTIKALCSTRFEAALRHSSERYPDVDFVVFQPDEVTAKLMAGSPMRYRIRTQLIELAYKGTLRKLRERHTVYSVKMGRYGFQLRSPDDLKALEANYREILKTAVA